MQRIALFLIKHPKNEDYTDVEIFNREFFNDVPSEPEENAASQQETNTASQQETNAAPQPETNKAPEQEGINISSIDGFIKANNIKVIEDEGNGQKPIGTKIFSIMSWIEENYGKKGDEITVDMPQEEIANAVTHSLWKYDTGSNDYENLLDLVSNAKNKIHELNSIRVDIEKQIADLTKNETEQNIPTRDQIRDKIKGYLARAKVNLSEDRINKCIDKVFAEKDYIKYSKFKKRLVKYINNKSKNVEIQNLNPDGDKPPEDKKPELKPVKKEEAPLPSDEEIKAKINQIAKENQIQEPIDEESMKQFVNMVKESRDDLDNYKQITALLTNNGSEEVEGRAPAGTALAKSQKQLHEIEQRNQQQAQQEGEQQEQQSQENHPNEVKLVVEEGKSFEEAIINYLSGPAPEDLKAKCNELVSNFEQNIYKPIITSIADFGRLITCFETSKTFNERFNAERIDSFYRKIYYIDRARKGFSCIIFTKSEKFKPATTEEKFFFFEILN